VPDPVVLAERRERHAELRAQQALRRAGEAEAAVVEAEARLAGLEHELAAARGEGERLRGEVARAGRAHLVADQIAHSEAAIRLEAAREHAGRTADYEAHALGVLELLEAVQIRARGLAREVEALRRATDEAAAPAARPAGAAAGAKGRDPRDVARRRARALASEIALARSALRAAPGSGPTAAVGTIAPAGLTDAGSAAALASDDLPAALVGVGPADAPGGVGPAAAPSGVGPAAAPGGVGAAAAPADAPRAAVTHDRLAAALARLRAESPPPPQPSSIGDAAARPSRPDAPSGVAEAPTARPAAGWLLPALKRLLREDPESAGGVLIGLLPTPVGAVRYDLVHGPTGWLVAPLDAGTGREYAGGEGGFALTGGVAALVRLLVRGSLFRRLGRRLAGVRGDRAAVDAVEALAARIREPVSLGELERARVPLEPGTTISLVACMIDPSWTSGRRFTLGHESRAATERAYLLVRDGASPRMSRHPPLGPVASTIVCPDEQLLAVLVGDAAPDAAVIGDAEALAVVREWLARAVGGPRSA
jgi:hypothetical protein